MKLPVYSISEIQQQEQVALKKWGIDPLILMEHAALGAVYHLKNRFGDALSLTKGVVFAGVGNNGADALAVARILILQHQVNPTIVILGDTKKISSLFSKQLAILKKLKQKVLFSFPQNDFDWVIDGLFGIGLNRNLDKKVISQIEKINQMPSYLLSLDIPSGLHADTGRAMPIAIKASHTVTFGAIKKGLLTAQASDHVGNLSAISLPIPQQPGEIYYLEKPLASDFPNRSKSSHKGKFGHVYTLLGQKEKQGASILSSLAALYSGAGLSTLVIPSKSQISKEIPNDLMVVEQDSFWNLPHRQMALVAGPGLGIDEGWDTIEKALKLNHPLILDGDAFTHIENHFTDAKRLLHNRRSIPTVLTPHPKEASRLLKMTVEEIEQDRYSALRKLVELTKSCVVLKGKGTLIGFLNHKIVVVTSGNSALAKGGSGDVLSGIIAAFLMQNLSLESAVPLAVWTHGQLAELWIKKGYSEMTLSATKQIELLSEVIP